MKSRKSEKKNCFIIMLFFKHISMADWNDVNIKKIQSRPNFPTVNQIKIFISRKIKQFVDLRIAKGQFSALIENLMVGIHILI